MGSVLYQLLAAMHADRTIWHVPECHVDWLEVLVILVCYRPHDMFIRYCELIPNTYTPMLCRLH